MCLIMMIVMSMMLPILVTPVEIVTDVSDIHESKARSPNDRV